MSFMPAVQAEQEQIFLRFARMIRNIFDVEAAAVSLIEDEMQHFLAADGIALDPIPLDQSLCRTTWHSMTRTVINDAAMDPIYRSHPLVCRPPFIRAYLGQPLFTSDGVPLGTICALDRKPRQFTEHDIVIFDDLARTAGHELELRNLAMTDTLTGALTRRSFERQSRRLCEWAAEAKRKVSIVLLDLDRFKRINDRFGHGAGDEVLAVIATIGRTALRENDCFGRHGGEEFVIAVEGSSARAARMAERLRARIAALPFRFAGEPVQVTGSFGVALVESPADLTDAIARADRALYAAKAGGRNRIVIHTPDMEPAARAATYSRIAANSA